MTEEAASEPKRCEAHRRDGSDCRSFALPGSTFCFAHDPKMRDRARAARSKGGANSARIVRLRGLIPPRLLPVYEKLEKALQEVHDGELPATSAQAMASLARAMVATLTAGEIEERLRRLEESANERD